MDKYTATEQAYKNGYERGYNDGKKEAEDEILILKQKRANIFEILDAYERGMDNALKWIPVSERLPNQGDAVLVFDKYRCYYIGEYLYGESFKAIGYHSMTTAVAWMPLPEPPKEE